MTTSPVRFCRNCGDPYDRDAEIEAFREWNAQDGVTANYQRTRWKPCPSPSPGRQLKDCDVGGHMYNQDQPGAD